MRIIWEKKKKEIQDSRTANNAAVASRKQTYVEDYKVQHGCSDCKRCDLRHDQLSLVRRDRPTLAPARQLPWRVRWAALPSALYNYDVVCDACHDGRCVRNDT